MPQVGLVHFGSNGGTVYGSVFDPVGAGNTICFLTYQGGTVIVVDVPGRKVFARAIVAVHVPLAHRVR